MQHSYKNIAIALAGIVQAISLVRQLAHTGKVSEEAFNASIYSLFQTDLADAAAAYGDLRSIRMGLEILTKQMGAKPDRVITRYMLSVIHLQKKLARSKKLSTHLAQRMQQIKKQVDYFSLTHPTVISNLADVYTNTISTFNFRIIVWGNQRVLGAQENMEKIRALLLASARSAALWRQTGGSRWHFIFSRAKIKEAAEQLLLGVPQD